MEIDKKRSRRYFIIKILMIIFTAYSIFPLVMILATPKTFEPFTPYFITTNTIILGVIGTWIGFISAKKNNDSNSD